MKLIIKSLATIFIVSNLACESSGGVWLGEGNNSGNPYTFGPNQDVEMLKNLAKAYSEKNVEKLSSYYSQEYMNESRKENYSKWLNSMESITMKPYKIIPLRNGGGMRLTISKYYLPSGKSISEVGVTPDILVEETGDDFKINTEKDNQLNYAIKLFNS